MKTKEYALFRSIMDEAKKEAKRTPLELEIDKLKESISNMDLDFEDNELVLDIEVFANMNRLRITHCLGFKIRYCEGLFELTGYTTPIKSGFFMRELQRKAFDFQIRYFTK